VLLLLGTDVTGGVGELLIQENDKVGGSATLHPAGSAGRAVLYCCTAEVAGGGGCTARIKIVLVVSSGDQACELVVAQPSAT